jgi:ATP-dependent Lhr-like helicase
LWDGVARGLFTADGFQAIRALLRGAKRSNSSHRSLSRLRRGADPIAAGAGRWSLVPDAGEIEDPSELAEAVADQLLQRWGVLFYDLVAYEGVAVPWRDLQWALRRLEDRGLILGGRFVVGFSGEQYALPAAVETMKAVRRRADDGSTISVSACDPLNLTGVLLPGPRVPAVRTNRVDIPV